MARRRNKHAVQSPVATANGQEADDSEYADEESEDYQEEYDSEDAEAVDGEDEAEYDAEAEYDEDADYEDDTEAEYDEDAEDEYEDEYDEDSDEEPEEPFEPPSAAGAIRQSLFSRGRAQPASGTAADAAAVKFIDKRERIIGFFFGGILMVLAVVSYFEDRHLIYKSSLKIQNEVRHAAPEVLAILLILGGLIVIATAMKRRAPLGFAILFSGMALLSTFGNVIFGIAYLATGLWLVFRSLRKTSRSAAATAGGGARGRAGTTARASRLAPSTSSSTASAKPSVPGRTIGRNGRASSSTPAYKPPAASGRYTPPKPVRRIPTAEPEPEPTNRISSWLRK